MADGYGIEQLEAYIDKLQGQDITLDMNKLLEEVRGILKAVEKIWDQNVKGDKPTVNELKEIKKQTRDFIQSAGVATRETTAYFNIWFRELERRLDTLTKTRFLHSANANFSNAGQMSRRALDSGIGSVIFNTDKKSAQGNLLAQQINKGYMPQLIAKVDSIRDTILHVWNQKKSGEKKERRQFVEDLVDGLARSKFFGGAITDFIRLGTFFIASWLKDKGPLGKALAVALVAAGPLIGQAIAVAVTLAFTKAILSVAKFLFIEPIKWLGRTILSAIGSSKLGSSIGSFIGSLFGRGGGNKLVGRALATTAGVITTDSIITGIGTAGTTLGTGAITGLGSAGTTAATAGAVGGAGAITGIGTATGTAAATGGTIAAFATGVGEILLILAGIAAVIGAFWYAWRKWGPNIEKKIDELKGENGSWLDVFNDIRDDANDKLDEHPALDKMLRAASSATTFGVGGMAYDLFRNSSNSRAFIEGEGASYGSLKVGRYGEITNARDLSQAQLSRYLGAYQKADPDRFNRVYEVVPEGFASMVDFQNDAVSVDPKTGKKGAVLYKGATEDLKKVRDYLVDRGMDPSKANQLMFTSGIATKTSGHAKGGVHDSKFGYGFDLVGKGWSQQDMMFADPLIKSWYAQYGSSKVNYEITKDGRHIFTTPDKGTNNAHWDVLAMSDNYPTMESEKNAAEYSAWAESQRKSIKVAEAEEAAAKAKKEEEKRSTDDWLKRKELLKANDKAVEVINPNYPNVLVDFVANEKTSKVLQNTVNSQQWAAPQY